MCYGFGSGLIARVRTGFVRVVVLGFIWVRLGRVTIGCGLVLKISLGVGDTVRFLVKLNRLKSPSHTHSLWGNSPSCASNRLQIFGE